MPQDGEINLKEVIAKYSVEDLHLVDRREVDFADEFRLTSEISFAIGLTLLGVVLTNFSWPFFVVTIIFIAFGVISFIRYFRKRKKLKKNTNSS